MSDPLWLVLDPINYIDGNQWDRFLGAVVKNPRNPGADRVPDNPAKFRLYPVSETTFDWFKYQDGNRHTDSNDFLVQGLAKICRFGGSSKTLDLAGGSLRIKRLQQCEMLWSHMKLDLDLFATVAGWVGEKKYFFRRKYLVCWIVGIVVCENPLVSFATSKDKQKQVHASVPIGSLAGVAAASQGLPINTGGTGDVEVGSSHENTTGLAFNGGASGSRVVAIEVRWVKSKHRLPDDSASISRQLAAATLTPDALEIQCLPDEFWSAAQDSWTGDDLPDGLADHKSLKEAQASRWAGENREWVGEGHEWIGEDQELAGEHQELAGEHQELAGEHQEYVECFDGPQVEDVD